MDVRAQRAGGECVRTRGRRRRRSRRSVVVVVSRCSITDALQCQVVVDDLPSDLSSVLLLLEDSELGCSESCDDAAGWRYAEGGAVELRATA
jgi:hypothetical protein